MKVRREIIHRAHSSGTKINEHEKIHQEQNEERTIGITTTHYSRSFLELQSMETAVPTGLCPSWKLSPI